MNAVTKVPAAYRPRDLGPNQRRFMERQGWIDHRIIRTKSHAPDCPHVHDVSAYICSCQEKPNAE
jgi:hypothetical protein